MSNSLFGITVAREIPDTALVGLATGRYTLHGGVIRGATGTPEAGQIICHLLPAASAGPTETLLSGAGFIARAAGTVAIGSVALPVAAGAGIISAKILKLAKQTMALAEMNLTATQAGFTSLGRRLDQLESKLNEIKTSLDAIHRLLQIEQRAELRIALQSLNQIDLINDPLTRRELLVHSAMTLGKISHIYELHLDEAPTAPEAMICEEYYCIALLAQARCYAELREPAMARQILEATHKRWQTLARKLIKQYLLDAYPEKFLSSQFADVSIFELIEWLDFAYDTAKGYTWIDELRAKSDPWYYKGAFKPTQPQRMISRSAYDEIIDLHQTLIIPAIQKLIARNRVLETYIAQYELMAIHRLTTREFDAQLATIDIEAQIDDFIILELKHY